MIDCEPVYPSVQLGVPYPEEPIEEASTALYTELRDGTLHIALGADYVGNVACYEGSLSRFFAWLFNRSLSVTFDREVYTINKNSYTQLISTLTQVEKISDIGQYTLFRQVVENTPLRPNPLKMRHVITEKERQERFEALAYALSQGNTARALMMIGKGADVDSFYYERGLSLSPSFTKDTDGLAADKEYSFTVFYAPPVLQAARKGCTAVVNFLKKAGANMSPVGTEYQFSREITQVRTEQYVEKNPVQVPYHYTAPDANGVPCDRIGYYTDYRPVPCERTVVDTKDWRSPQHTLMLRDF